MLSFFLNIAFFRHFSCVFIIHIIVESSEADLHQLSTAYAAPTESKIKRA